MGTKPMSTSMPWASMWTSGWSSLVPSGSLSWEWATMTGSECSKPSLSCWASPPWDPRAPAVRCQGPSGPGVGCGTGAECKAMVSAETPCHTGKGVAHPPAPPEWAFLAFPHPCLAQKLDTSGSLGLHLWARQLKRSPRALGDTGERVQTLGKPAHCSHIAMVGWPGAWLSTSSPQPGGGFHHMARAVLAGRV